MFFNAFAIASVYLFSLWWCYEVIRCLPKDIREIIELKEAVRTFSIVFIWIITIPILIGVILYGYVLITRLLGLIHTL